MSLRKAAEDVTNHWECADADSQEFVNKMNKLRAALSEPDELQAENDALKAHVERLLITVTDLCNTFGLHGVLKSVRNDTPTQSLSAHDAALIGECADLCPRYTLAVNPAREIQKALRAKAKGVGDE